MASLISYAQNFEDVILWRALSHVVNGCYVDVGAQSPDTDSVSRLFYEKGWRGVHVEPEPRYAAMLRESRPDEVVLQVAVSDKPGILQFFNVADTGLSTTDPTIAEWHRQSGFVVSDMRVPAVPLDTVLDQLGDRPVHWLKIDVEGAELAVMEGWSTSAVRPWVVVVESTWPLSPEQTHAPWESVLQARDYEFVYFDGLNRFYVSREHPELKSAFAAGPNVFDDFWLSSHSQFCGLVNTNYAELQAQGKAQVAELEERAAAQVAELEERNAAQVSELQEWAAAQVSELESRLAQTDAVHADQLDCLQAELELRAAELERQRNEHAAALSAMVESQHRIVADHNEVLEASVESFTRKIAAREASTDELRREIAVLEDQIQAGRNEAHRWWLAHEQLLAERDAMLSSRSWQLTRPLRDIQRRLSFGALVHVKPALRSVAVRMLRMAVVSPRLRALTKPVVCRIPFLYDRLRNMAVQAQLIEGELPLQQRVLGGIERDQESVYLDKRARRVLFDLKQPRNRAAAR